MSQVNKKNTSKPKYTLEEDLLLLKGVQEFANGWTQIAEKYPLFKANGREGRSLGQRYVKLTAPRKLPPANDQRRREALEKAIEAVETELEEEGKVKKLAEEVAEEAKARQKKYVITPEDMSGEEAGDQARDYINKRREEDKKKVEEMEKKHKKISKKRKNKRRNSRRGPAGEERAVGDLKQMVEEFKKMEEEGRERQAEEKQKRWQEELQMEEERRQQRAEQHQQMMGLFAGLIDRLDKKKK
jgi:hypothetical protein